MPRTPIHPGEILADELKELGVSPTELSRQLALPARLLLQVVHGKRPVSGDVALRLGHWFQTSGQFWLNLQSAYDLDRAAALAGQDIEKLPTRAGATGPSFEEIMRSP